MVQKRKDGQLAVTSETMPTEQANVQLPTVEGEVGQQTKAHQALKKVSGVLSGHVNINSSTNLILAASLIALVGIGAYTVKQFVDKTTRKEGDGNE